tara:strand:- start:64 stop:576 length:513 start_codon:yes stop_codon:yes gene_type:complete
MLYGFNKGSHKMITQSQLKNLFYYKLGNLYWKERVNSAVNLDKPAGCKSLDARAIRINKKLYLEHRLVFLFHHGFLPAKIDHKDGNRSNNSICNLRECTSAQNSWNSKTPINNTSGVKGVAWNSKNNSWRVRLKCNGKTVEIGSFNDINEAEKAVKKAREALHKEFARHS